MSLKQLEAFVTLMETILPEKAETIIRYQRDPKFAQKIDSLFQNLLEGDIKKNSPSPKRRSRRNPATLDPFDLYKQGRAEGLRQELENLEVEQLKDIIAEHGMDSSRRAMAWKKPERLVELIVQTVSRRARQGDAFRSS